MEKESNIRKKAISFILSFIVGFGLGFFFCAIGGFFHNAPDIMWKETIFVSSIFGVLTVLFGDSFIEFLGKIF